MKRLGLAVAVLVLVPGFALAEQEGAKGPRTSVPENVQKTLQDIQQTLGFVPTFFKRFPEQGLPGAWEEVKVILVNPSTALTRHWSTFLNGAEIDLNSFMRDTDRVVKHVREEQARMGKEGTALPAGAPKMETGIEIDTPAAAYRDIERTFGFVPGFLREFPKEVIVGAWKEMKALEIGPTVFSPKLNHLIGLGVAAQIPCTYCTYFHTQAAKVEGTTEDQVREAVVVAGITRPWSAVVNCLEINQTQFREEVNRMLDYVNARRLEMEKARDGTK